MVFSTGRLTELASHSGFQRVLSAVHLKTLAISRRWSIVLFEVQFSDAQINRPQGAMSSAATARIHRQSELFPTETKDSKARPFLKWAGGKTRLLPVLRTLLARQTFRKYYEPFLGGAALFFDIGPKTAVLNDRNP